jgi:hypothetical protein
MDERAAFGDPRPAGPVAWTEPTNVNLLRGDRETGRRGAASPRLSQVLLTRLLGYGTPQQTRKAMCRSRRAMRTPTRGGAEGSVEVIRAGAGERFQRHGGGAHRRSSGGRTYGFVQASSGGDSAG